MGKEMRTLGMEIIIVDNMWMINGKGREFCWRKMKEKDTQGTLRMVLSMVMGNWVIKIALIKEYLWMI